jgi:hypothetical protein
MQEIFFLTRTTIPYSVGTSITTIANLDKDVVPAQPSPAPTQPHTNVHPHELPQPYSYPTTKHHIQTTTNLSHEYPRLSHTIEQFGVVDNVQNSMYNPSRDQFASKDMDKIFGSWETQSIKKLVIAKLSSTETDSCDNQFLDEISAESNMDRVEGYPNPSCQLFETVDLWLAGLVETPPSPETYVDEVYADEAYIDEYI